MLTQSKLSEMTIDELFNCHQANLQYFACKYLNDADSAKDIVQETFIIYWTHKDKLHLKPESVKPFFYSSVRNACLNKLRRIRLESFFLSIQDNNPSEEPICLNSIMRSEVISELHSALLTLPKNYQEIFRMSYLEELKNAEIAQQMGLSINTIKTHKKQGLRLLRKLISKDKCC
ncbi:RNA polymerase sigma-70 factor [Pedobacter sp. MC2016-14]|uniref:RNA polymerase sigma-70 factor n=1 Tax=Pedobacter sp. MC2016-14 TaxID=2897327 RepID=UPI001E636B00|nr:RNA polymerase sigma-70 factor [Pedobacter sp. MC2016-14]MCD0487403.1 RNA polymerase sigma-70 factor [Pedobacter sp. MC2016-14]